MEIHIPQRNSKRKSFQTRNLRRLKNISNLKRKSRFNWLKNLRFNLQDLLRIIYSIPQLITLHVTIFTINNKIFQQLKTPLKIILKSRTEIKSKIIESIRIFNRNFEISSTTKIKNKDKIRVLKTTNLKEIRVADRWVKEKSKIIPAVILISGAVVEL